MNDKIVYECASRITAGILSGMKFTSHQGDQYRKTVKEVFKKNIEIVREVLSEEE